MMRRYFSSADASSAPAPPAGLKLGSISVVNENSTTVTQKTNWIGGSPGALVTFQITSYRTSDPANAYFSIVGYGYEESGSIFTAVLDGSGNFSFTSIVYAGPAPTGGTFVTVSIISVSAGAIGTPSSASYSKTL